MGSNIGEEINFGASWRSSSKQCFMDDDIANLGLRYLRDWLKVYKGKRRYFLYRNCQMHNYYAETSHDMDQMLENFLIDVLGTQGKKEPNLAIRIYADHGDHTHLARYTKTGDLDRMSPIMINVVPKQFLDYHSDSKLTENFTTNSKKLTTSPDLFWTDLGLIGGKKGYNDENKKYGWLVDEVRKSRKEEY
jgi:Protein of unknown function (DUF229)